MGTFFEIIGNSYSNYYNYLVKSVFNPSFHNFFYWMIGISLIVWVLEIIFPWRKEQKVFRKDFWLDLFYMFFNIFLFSLVGYNALSNIGVHYFNKFLNFIGLENLVAFQIQSWPVWSKFAVLFIVSDFIQWNIHRLLHSNKFLWEFHKVHHSVEQMGFAAHFRYHWMETIVYKSLLYIPIGMIGFGIQDFLILHLFTVSIGHINHSNIKITYGPLKYILNNPVMHLWHHSKEIPKGKSGVNFGISLSLWDYIFKTNYIPSIDENIKLGFDNDEKFPKNFIEQEIYPLIKTKPSSLSQQPQT